MCYAILRVSYHFDKAKDLIEVDKQEDYTKRLAEVRGRPGVKKVTVFSPLVSFEEVHRWEVLDHQTGVKVYEEVNQVPISSGKEIPEEVPAHDGSYPSEGISVGPVEADGKGSSEACGDQPWREVGPL